MYAILIRVRVYTPPPHVVRSYEKLSRLWPAVDDYRYYYVQCLYKAGALPDTVHKTSCGGDWWQLGSYVAGEPKILGNFSASAPRALDAASSA